MVRNQRERSRSSLDIWSVANRVFLADLRTKDWIEPLFQDRSAMSSGNAPTAHSGALSGKLEKMSTTVNSSVVKWKPQWSDINDPCCPVSRPRRSKLPIKPSVTSPPRPPPATFDRGAFLGLENGDWRGPIGGSVPSTRFHFSHMSPQSWELWFPSSLSLSSVVTAGNRSLDPAGSWVDQQWQARPLYDAVR